VAASGNNKNKNNIIINKIKNKWMMAWHRLRRCIRVLRSKTGRMVIMLILTVSIAIAEIIYGLRTRSQLLIADGLFSFAEGIALVGSLIALRYARAERLHSKNTFGYLFNSN
jgi:Co/Zn/Cd efflux system component